MDRQAAYDLFIAGLERKGIKGIDLKKDVIALLAWGYSHGVFANPHTVHQLTEWRKLGELLWDAVLEDDKTAKKMGKIWRVIHNTLLQSQADRRAAEEALKAAQKNASYGHAEQENVPLAPGTNTVVMPAPGGMSESVQPSAPPLKEEPQEEPGDRSGGEHGKPPCSCESPKSVPPKPSPEKPNSVESDPVPGALSDLWEEMAKQRREAWSALARHGLDTGDTEVVDAVGTMACPVTYTPVVDPQGQVINQLGTYSPLDWKLLAQLRQTVSQFGFKSEPAKQMLDYLFNSTLLLPNDLRAITKLIFTQHQQLLFNAHWQALVNEAVAVQRGQGDPLNGVTADELMGLGPYLRTEAQMIAGPDKVREAMRIVRLAISQVKDSQGIPMYMGIKQGREETFGAFIDRVAAAIEKAGVQEYMKGALLKQCALQNSNESTKRVLSTLGANWSIEEALERMALQPSGSQAFLVNAIKELGLGIQKQAESTQSQVLAALAPLQASALGPSGNNGRLPPAAKCYRCGQGGHFRRTCRVTGVWCQACQSNSHNSAACRRRSGNPRRSANNGRAQTQVAAVASAPSPAHNPPLQGAWGSTWQQQ
ncbi:GAK7 protein, partial [Pterocles burchelli]|nr:GAK7 protein [Pterocles burchelli]